VSEKEQAKRLGGRLQKNSGRGKVKKGDIILGRFLIDLKEYSKSFSLSRKVWAKVNSDAWLSGNMEPALNVILSDDDGTVRLMVFDEEMGKAMMELWNDTHG
jgi:hypothetical protein